MLPFFFGSKQRRLFGVYEEATHNADAGAALLCGSWGIEYTNAHRAMRVLSKRLCATGFDTLRFDYFGSGDSSGDTIDAELDGWKDDISTALQELKEISGKPRIVIVGMRLGATLAAELAAQPSVEIDGIVLWDPILSGFDYVSELRDRQRNNLARPFDSSDTTGSELGGLSVSSSFVCGLNSIDLSLRELRLPSKVLTIFTEAQHPDRNIRSSFGKNSEVITLKAPLPWRDSTEQEEGLPVEVFERILAWLR
jgi:pimeloyl-ACP methyl ester carboxylesterase